MDPTQTLHISACPACGSAQWRNIFRIKQWDIKECRRCGFACIDPLPLMDLRGDFYKEEQVVTRNVVKKRSLPTRVLRKLKLWGNRMAGRSKSNIFHEKLKAHVPAGKDVLDIGCGDGGFLDTLRKDYRTFGVEISDYLADFARKRGGMQIYTGDFLNTDFQHQTFDGITLISLIEHIPDPAATLEKSHRLLNDNGIFLLKTVNYKCWNRALLGKKWTGFRPPDHVVYFTPENLKQLLSRIGFKKIRFTAWPLNDNMYCEAWK
jgi:2-polyprenyl-3-methyl-5-hydroxy-6-metoxy-1,4-benzoquinol methylase